MTQIIIRCENCDETHKVESMEDADIEGCETDENGLYADEGLHKFEIVAEINNDENDESEDMNDNNGNTDDWKTMSSDECKKRNGLEQVNGVLWESA